MGYYVRIVKSNCYLLLDKADEAHRLMCELNQHNDLKRESAISI